MGRAGLRLLLDSHALIWWLGDDRRLSPLAKRLISESDCLVSAVSAYEITLKFQLGKLQEAAELVTNFKAICAAQGFELLPIGVDHALRGAMLASAYRDPFDRLLAAQSLIEDIAIVSCDCAIGALGAQVFW